MLELWQQQQKKFSFLLRHPESTFSPCVKVQRVIFKYNILLLCYVLHWDGYTTKVILHSRGLRSRQLYSICYYNVLQSILLCPLSLSVVRTFYVVFFVLSFVQECCKKKLSYGYPRLHLFISARLSVALKSLRHGCSGAYKCDLFFISPIKVIIIHGFFCLLRLSVNEKIN